MKTNLTELDFKHAYHTATCAQGTHLHNLSRCYLDLYKKLEKVKAECARLKAAMAPQPESTPADKLNAMLVLSVVVTFENAIQ